MLSKIVVLLIIIVLIIGWHLVNDYVYSNRVYVGKGTRDTFFESILYSLSLLTAITELSILIFKGVIFRVFFFYASTANILFFILCTYIIIVTGGFDIIDSHDPLTYLTFLPFLCDGILFIIFLMRNKYSK